MQKVHVNASRSYDIFIGGGLLDKSGEYISAAIKARHVCVVTDDNVDPLYSERLMKSLVESGFSAEKVCFSRTGRLQNATLRSSGCTISSLKRDSPARTLS